MSDIPPPPPPPAPAGAPSSGLANFGQRLVAYFLDGIIIGVPFAILFFVAIAAAPKELVVCEGGTAICEQPTGAGFAMLLVVYLVGFVAAIWYIAEFEGRRGATIGRRVMGTRVVDAQSGDVIGAGRAVGRYFGKIVSGIPCYLGFFWMLWDTDNQTWHDKMTNSKVVRD